MRPGGAFVKPNGELWFALGVPMSQDSSVTTDGITLVFLVVYPVGREWEDMEFAPSARLDEAGSLPKSLICF